MTIDSPATAAIPAIADDGSLYPVGKMEAHERGLLHLAISIFVFDGQGNLLIQQRALDKYHCGGQWANTCCSHPHWGETIEACADRRLREELGTGLPLQPIGAITYRADVGNGLVEHERVHMFRGTADPRDWQPKPDPAEVSAVRWVSMDQLKRTLAEAPQTLTPWFRIYLSHWSGLWAPVR